jgi:hypothetical protein
MLSFLKKCKEYTKTTVSHCSYIQLANIKFLSFRNVIGHCFCSAKTKIFKIFNLFDITEIIERGMSAFSTPDEQQQQQYIRRSCRKRVMDDERLTSLSLLSSYQSENETDFSVSKMGDDEEAENETDCISTSSSFTTSLHSSASSSSTCFGSTLPPKNKRRKIAAMVKKTGRAKKQEKRVMHHLLLPGKKTHRKDKVGEDRLRWGPQLTNLFLRALDMIPSDGWFVFFL